MNRMLRSLRLAGLSLGVLLSGCSAIPTVMEADDPSVHEADWQAHMHDIRSLENWQLDGRVAARDGEYGTNFSVNWTQLGASYRIRLAGPFGQGSAVIAGRPGEVTLDQGKNSVTATSPDSLFARFTHLDMPLESLPYWLRGIPAPGSPANVTLSDQARLAHLQQQDWDIRYEAYAGSPALPTRLTLENRPQRARIIIDQWTMETAQITTPRL